MLVPISLLCLIGLAFTNYYPITQNLDTYYQAWNTLGSKLQKIDLKHIANPQEQCGTGTCPFKVYIDDSPFIAVQPNRNKTVLIVGALRGNDVLGPATILNLYGKIRAAKIIYFPIANPSGFMKQQIQTYPTGVKIEEDFPLLDRSKCNQSSAVRILDYLFRTYHIDLTIYIHEGAPGITHSWTSKEFRPNKTFEEQPIYDWIASTISQKYYRNAAANKQPITQFYLNQERSDIIDWAFGASKHSEIFTKTCNTKQYDPYTPYMMNGLAIGLTIGERYSTVVNGENSQKSIIQRAITLTNSLVSMINPSVQLRIFQNKTIEARLQGCKNANLTIIKLFNDNNTYVEQVKINKIVTNSKTWQNLGTIVFDNQKEWLDKGELNIQFICDADWVNRGTTMFSHYRQYYSQHFYTILEPQNTTVNQIIPKPAPAKAQQPTVAVISNQNRPTAATTQQTYNQSEETYDLFSLLKIGAIGVFGLFALCCVINCWQVASKIFKDKIKARNEKFEMIQYAETIDQDMNLKPKADHSLHKQSHSESQPI